MKADCLVIHGYCIMANEQNGSFSAVLTISGIPESHIFGHILKITHLVCRKKNFAQILFEACKTENAKKKKRK